MGVRFPPEAPRKIPLCGIRGKHMHFVYLLESAQDRSWYIGYTPDTPQNRLMKHNSGSEYFTKRKMPWKLIYFEAYIEQRDATNREKFLKSGAGRIFIKKQIKIYLDRFTACE